MQSEIVRFEDVSLSYGRNRVLNEISFAVGAGEIFGILGRIGVGKTRILRLIAGLEKPNSGTVTKNFEDFGFVFQNDLLIPWLNVKENLRLCARDRGSFDARVYVEDLYD